MFTKRSFRALWARRQPSCGDGSISAPCSVPGTRACVVNCCVCKCIYVSFAYLNLVPQIPPSRKMGGPGKLLGPACACVRWWREIRARLQFASWQPKPTRQEQASEILQTNLKLRSIRFFPPAFFLAAWWFCCELRRSVSRRSTVARFANNRPKRPARFVNALPLKCVYFLATARAHQHAFCQSQ